MRPQFLVLLCHLGQRPALFSLVLPVEMAGGLAVWGYAFRECEQQWKSWRRKKRIDVLDAVLDVVAPAVAAAAVWLWLS